MRIICDCPRCREEVAQKLAASFPEGYWKPFRDEFGHDFFQLHLDRTIGYNTVLCEDIEGKRVLEVGGYPGLLASMLLLNYCRVTTVEWSRFMPDWYLDWAYGHGVDVRIHDIVRGRPNFIGYWDYAIMSDVLLHLDGFPFEFMSWLIKNIDMVVIGNYNRKEKGELYPVANSSLRRVYDIPPEAVIDAEMLRLGAAVTKKIVVGDRLLTFYSRSKCQSLTSAAVPTSSET